MKEHFPTAGFKLVKSSGGVFEVSVDGQLIFSKKRMGRHAAPGEVRGLVEKVSGERDDGFI